MHIMKKAAASMSAVGLLAFGLVAGDGGSALARVAGPAALPSITGSGTSVTACSAEEAGLAVGLFPKCTAGTATVNNPTSMVITLNTTALGSLLNILPTLGLQATWNLFCDVDGSTVTKAGSYTVSTVAQSATDTIDLQNAVGSPNPTKCTVSNLQVQSTVALTLLTSTLGLFTIGVAATANTAIPGAIYQNEGKTPSGASAVLCADDTGNGDSGSKIQAFQCLSDLADYYIQTSSGQLVHNGDCMDLAGSRVILATCTAGDASQQWSQSTVGGTLTNQSSNTCLTAPSAKDGTQLTVTSCANKADQKWHIPDASV